MTESRRASAAKWLAANAVPPVLARRSRKIKIYTTGKNLVRDIEAIERREQLAQRLETVVATIRSGEGRSCLACTEEIINRSEAQINSPRCVTDDA